MIILDTHIWFWFINQEFDRFPKAWQNMIETAVNLTSIHKDPFDRIIIATTIEYQAQLASIDNLFSKYVELEKYLLKQ